MGSGVELAGALTGYCHIMAGAKVTKGATLHQFTTVGSASFVTMGTKVRYDVLPYCAFDETTVVLDRVALQRLGTTPAQAEELQSFYETHLASMNTFYLQDFESLVVARPEQQTAWFMAALSRFFAIRASMRDRRLLARFGSAPGSSTEMRLEDA